MHIFYRVEPTWSDGYIVEVELRKRPIVHAYVKRLKYVTDSVELGEKTYPLAKHESIEYPRVRMDESDVDSLMQMVATARIPLSSPEQTGDFDGTGYQLSVDDAGFRVMVGWGDALPKALADLRVAVELLDKYARRSLS